MRKSNLFGRIPAESCVYLIQYSNEPIYKIGHTDKPARRLARVQVSVPYPVKIVHIILTDAPEWLETYWHRRFASKRRRGSAYRSASEWFNLTDADVAEFKANTRLDQQHEYKLNTVLPVVFDAAARHSAIRRVTAHYDSLIARSPEHAVILTNSCLWEIARLSKIEVNAEDREAEQRAVAEWEAQAYEAAKHLG